MKAINFLDQFIDWKKNYDQSIKDLSLGISFERTFDINSLKNSLIPILEEENISNFYFEGIEQPLNKERFQKKDLKPIEIYPLKEKNIQEIFIGKSALTITFLSENVDMALIHKLICKNELMLATFGDSQYVSWQNRIGPRRYKYKKGLKIVVDKTTNEKFVDISNRPGRSFTFGNVVYNGSSKLWFGPKIYQYIPQETILDFKGAVEIKVLENNVTFVHLYEGIYDGFAPHNQEVQRRFREHIKIDSLKID